MVLTDLIVVVRELTHLQLLVLVAAPPLAEPEFIHLLATHMEDAHLLIAILVLDLVAHTQFTTTALPILDLAITHH